MGQIDYSRRLLRLEINDLIFRFVNMHKPFEPSHQLWVRPNVTSSPLNKNLSVNEVRGIKVTEFEELAERRLVSNVFLDAVKEREFLLSWRHRGRRLDGFWQRGDEGRRNSRNLTLRRLMMVNLGSLFILSVIQITTKSLHKTQNKVNYR